LRLAELGLDYVSVSAGGRFEDAVLRPGEVLDPYTGYSGHRTMPPSWMDKKVNVHLADEIKAVLNQSGHTLPVIAAGRIPDAQTANEILEKGQADLIGIARPILCDPYWPIKYKENREKDILKCIYCNECREAEGVFQEVVCSRWKNKDGSIVPPTR
jgi:2,4-dienoyl-CoA reductase-like NADH-dependent reductase (Old Yellow Enzyme family)